MRIWCGPGCLKKTACHKLLHLFASLSSRSKYRCSISRIISSLPISLESTQVVCKIWKKKQLAVVGMVKIFCQMFGMDHKHIRGNQLIIWVMTITRGNSESFSKSVNLFNITKSIDTHANYFSGNTSSQRLSRGIKRQRWYGCTCNWNWLPMAMNLTLSFNEGSGCTVGENTFCLCLHPFEGTLFPEENLLHFCN